MNLHDSVLVLMGALQQGAAGLLCFGLIYTVVYTLSDYLVNRYKLIQQRRCKQTVQDLKGKHVMITGGSSGIGKAVATAFARRGANVSILARNAQKLSEAAGEIKAQVDAAAANASSRVKLFEMSVDLSTSFDQVDKAVKETISKMGPVFMLVNCAGFAVSRKFENLTPDDEQRMMNLNYFGSVWTTRAALPSMKEAGGGGTVVFVASQGSLVGLYGMTAYCGSKFAIRGFAESLAMELSPYKISVCVSCPPDTETPGFEAENVGKPEETQQICEYGGLFSPQEVGDQLVIDAMGIAGAGTYAMGTNGLDGWIAVRLCNGFTNSSLSNVIMEAFVLGPARLISWIYTKQFYRIIHKCHKKRNNGKKTEYST